MASAEIAPIGKGSQQAANSGKGRRLAA